MLDHAYFHREELEKIVKKEFSPAASLGRYKFLHTFSYHDFKSYVVESDTKRWIQMVSMSDGQINGYLAADVDRSVNAVKEMVVFGFKRSAEFSHDFRRFVWKLFLGYNFNKMSFTAVVGSPAERMYDHYVTKYGGRIVGTHKSHVKLIDGKVYDLKMYEMMRDDALKLARPQDKE